MNKCINIELGKTTIEKEPDYDADTSYLGEYGDIPKPGCIVRYNQTFIEDWPEDEELPERNREYRFFYPPDNGEEIGTADYKKYALQDYQVLEDLYNSQWSFCSIVITTEIKTDFGISDKVYSSLSGIEDHWDKDSDQYIRSVIEDLKQEQKDQLLKMGFSEKEIEKTFSGAEEKGID